MRENNLYSSNQGVRCLSVMEFFSRLIGCVFISTASMIESKRRAISEESSSVVYAQIALAVGIMAAGGPDIAVKVGRRDSKVAVPSGRIPSIDCERSVDVGPIEKAFRRIGLENKHALLMYSIIGLGEKPIGVMSLPKGSCPLSPICVKAALEVGLYLSSF